MSAPEQVLQFAPFASQISPSFWTSLASLKLDELQLSDSKISVAARYSTGKSTYDRTSGDTIHLPVNLHLDSDSLDQSFATKDLANEDPFTVRVKGSLKNFNTIEDFKKADKAALLQELGDEIIRAILHEDDPLSALESFAILSYADLKRYKFIYWFAFPALVAQPAWRITGAFENATQAFRETFHTMAANIAQRKNKDHNYFLIHPNGQIGSVMEFDQFFLGVEKSDRIVGFIDPSPYPSTPGWPLRNLLTLLRVRFKVDRIRVICWKDESGANPSKSVVLSVACIDENAPSAVPGGSSINSTSSASLPVATSTSTTQPIVVGWERNTSGKLAPKMADLGPLMDPSRLADQAVNLNLKLMRWRILPEINLDKVQSTRCLLLGAGTLGCYVARNLLGWGVRHITFVDSSTVSFSNPVRQPLFEFADCLHGGKPKAQCASDALRKIYPGVNSQGFQVNIPMPGHPIPAANVSQVRQDVQELDRLVDEHDVIYLLMDSRESRWLPTVLGAIKGKIVINTALGFDSFLAMRHGANPSQHAEHPNSTRLGCYFCNDVVAPTDSLSDRTLDQMCTVSRPGLAAIASAITAELTVSLLQHPLTNLAPAYSTSSHGVTVQSKDSSSILGRLPHQIRGTLFDFSNLMIHGPAYERCTACSTTILDTYRKDPFGVVQKACNDEGFLRTVTGLDKLYDATDDVEVDWSEEEEEDVL